MGAIMEEMLREGLFQRDRPRTYPMKFRHMAIVLPEILRGRRAAAWRGPPRPAKLSPIPATPGGDRGIDHGDHHGAQSSVFGAGGDTAAAADNAPQHVGPVQRR